MDQPTAEDAVRALDVLVGEWTLEAGPPEGDPWPEGGRAVFEWHGSGAHLPQRTWVELPEDGADFTVDFDLTYRKVRGGDDR